MRKGFTLIEVTSAVTILVFITFNVWVVIDRCINSTANTTIKMHAFEVARENMETLLAKNAVEETAEFGISERYPGIQWQTVVETFYEPVNSQMWLRALCSATYQDSKGEEQSVELEHWLTSLTKEQLMAIMMRDEETTEELTIQLIDDIGEAAIYAGVSEDTIKEWIDNGMLTTEDGLFIKNNLDLYKQSNGNPSNEDKRDLQIESEEDLRRLKMQQNQAEWQGEIDPKTGLSYGEIDQMDISEIWELLKNKQSE